MTTSESLLLYVEHFVLPYFIFFLAVVVQFVREFGDGIGCGRLAEY